MSLAELTEMLEKAVQAGEMTRLEASQLLFQARSTVALERIATVAEKFSQNCVSFSGVRVVSK